MDASDLAIKSYNDTLRQYCTLHSAISEKRISFVSKYVAKNIQTTLVRDSSDVVIRQLIEHS